MGKNFKEMNAYYYLNGIRDVPKNILIRLFKKWNRHNFYVGTMKAERVNKKEKIFDNDWKKELEDN